MYTGVRIEVLILKSESNVTSVNQPVNIVNDLGNVFLNKTNMLFFLDIYKHSDSMEHYNISKYLNIKI